MKVIYECDLSKLPRKTKREKNIAGALEKLDELIELSSKQVELYRKYRLALMQKFSVEHTRKEVKLCNRWNCRL